MLNCLARMDYSLMMLNMKRIFVHVYDDDKVNEFNVGRQSFLPSECGLYKSDVLVSKINAAYGLAWESNKIRYNEENCRTNYLNDIVITCTDNVASRQYVHKMISEQRKPYYWLDLGNNRNGGQALLGSSKIKQPKSKKYKVVDKLNGLEAFVNIKEMVDDPDEPSCSMAEALNKQDLFINSTLANMGASILWKLLKDKYITVNGLFFNMDTMTTNPVNI
jgi:PRTRC genetic system ThiF family protein